MFTFLAYMNACMDATIYATFLRSISVPLFHCRRKSTVFVTMLELQSQATIYPNRSSASPVPTCLVSKEIRDIIKIYKEGRGGGTKEREKKREREREKERKKERKREKERERKKERERERVCVCVCVL